MRWLHKYSMHKGDLVIIALVLALAGAILLPFVLSPLHTRTCEITQDGEVIRRIRLGAGYEDTITIRAGAYTNVIRIEGDAVYFIQSDCPDQVCVRTGKLTRAGQSAVCLPTRVVVRLAGTQTEVDAVVR